MNAEPFKPHRIPALDGLRAVSILMVLGRHVGAPRDLFPNGSFGVTVFFVLSGFLITHLLVTEEAKAGQISLRGFYRRRAFRILPPALVYLAAVIPLANTRELFFSVVFMRNLAGDGATTAHFWSLSVEEQFYLIWPLAFLLLGTSRRRLIGILLLLAAMPAWRYVGYHILNVGQVDHFTGQAGHDAVTASFKILSGHYPILIGCGLALARHEGFIKWAWSRTHTTAIAAAVGGAAVLTIFHGFLANALFPLFAAAVIHYCASARHTVLDWPPLAWLGRVSYSLYLWQEPFCWESPLGALGRFPLNLIASLVMACASYYLVERPVLRLRYKLVPQHPPARSRSAAAG